MTGPDDLARAASEAVDAWCAANPAPTWPAFGQWFTPNAEPIEVKYTRYVTPEEFLETLTDEQKRAVYNAATELAQCSRSDRDETLWTLLNVMANYRGADA